MKRFAFLTCFLIWASNAPAQSVMVSGSGPMMTAAMPALNQLDFLTNYLNLSSSQAEQAKPLFEGERDSIVKLLDAMKKAHDDLAAAEKSDQPDSEIERLAGVLGGLQGQLAAIHSKTMVHLHVLLTPEQRDKLDKLSGPGNGMAFGFGISGGSPVTASVPPAK